MGNSTLHIKNMVCPRCVEAVKDALDKSGIAFDHVKLGEAKVASFNAIQKKQFTSLLEAKGFELLETASSATIANIKGLIVEQIHYTNQPLKVNFSTYLSEKLDHDYSYLSRLFSSVESITIEKYITAQKIERVKELLIYDELTLTLIAHRMNYSSVAHLSAQFKKETGLTPSAFKKQQSPIRRFLDQI